MIENKPKELAELFVEEGFSFTKTQIQEIQHCLELEKDALSDMSPKKVKYIESVLMRHKNFFYGQRLLLLGKTPTKLFDKDDVIQTSAAATAYHNADWKALLKDFGFGLRLPVDLVCVEHLFENSFPITNAFGEVTLKMKGVVIFAKQIKHNDKDAILVDICSLCTAPNNSEILRAYNSAAHFMLTTNEKDDFVCLATEKETSDWVVFSANTAENISFLQLALLIILFKTNKSELCEPKIYKL